MCVRRRENVTFVYADKLRRVSPHVVGATKNGRALLFGLEYEDDGKPCHRWKNFDLAKIEAIEVDADSVVWHTSADFVCPEFSVVVATVSGRVRR